jgi:hypothetical protein
MIEEYDTHTHPPTNPEKSKVPTIGKVNVIKL